MWVRVLSRTYADPILGKSVPLLRAYKLCPVGYWCGPYQRYTCAVRKVLKRKYSTFLNPSLKQQTMDVQQFRKDAVEIFQASVDSVYPPQMIRNAVQILDNGCKLKVEHKEYILNQNVYVVGFGKAVLGMARAIEDLLGPHIVEGVISVPCGSQELFKSIGKSDLCLTAGSKVLVYEGAENNMPDEAAHKAAIAIQTLVKQLTEKDILVVLISGGGSALLPCPEEPISLKDELEMTSIMSKHGATIQQLNILRQNIETLKGGGLANLSYPASTISLILSDVINDKLDIISSGPTVPLLSSPRQCLQILDALNVKDKIPDNILSSIKLKAEEKKVAQGTQSSTSIQQYNSGCEHVHNVVIGSNAIATTAAFNKAEELNYIPLVLTNSLQGEAKEVAKMLVKLAKFVMLSFGDMPANQGNEDLVVTEIDLVRSGIHKSDLKQVETAAKRSINSNKGLCIVCGGETTVTVTGTGKGGRNQEMALTFAMVLDKLLSANDRKLASKFHVEFLSAGTDGQDGPTDAAGAVVNRNLVPIAISSHMNPEVYLSNNDSYHLFKELKNSDSLIRCGLTGTNVMDVQILLIKYLI